MEPASLPRAAATAITVSVAVNITIWAVVTLTLVGQAVSPWLGLGSVLLSMACVFFSPFLLVLNCYAALKAFAVGRRGAAVLACAGVVAVLLAFWLTAENGEWIVLFVRIPTGVNPVVEAAGVGACAAVGP